MYLLPLSTAWVPFTFDSLVYRSFSWNFIWQHSAFYKLAEYIHIKKKFVCVVKFIIERHYILLQQNQTFVLKSIYFLPPKVKASFETCTVSSRKFTACILSKTERKLWIHLPLALVSDSFFPEAIKSKTNFWWCHLKNPILFFIFISYTLSHFISFLNVLSWKWITKDFEIPIV